MTEEIYIASCRSAEKPDEIMVSNEWDDIKDKILNYTSDEESYCNSCKVFKLNGNFLGERT